MKKILLISIYLLVSVSFFAAPVDRETAKAVAKEFLSKRGIVLPDQPKIAYRAAKKSPVQQQNSYYYVFNVGNDAGFVVTSGDDRIDGILGYTDHGSFDINNMPDNMRAFLQSYADAIKGLDDHNVAETSVQRAKGVPGAVQVARHAIDPLITSRWNQGDPYNLKTPHYYNDDGTLGGLSATGCVATALAQVIGYYKYPNTLLNDLPEYSFTSGANKQIVMPAIPAGTTIDWNHVRDTYSDASTQAEKDAVSSLMLYVGQLVRMGYGPSSGAGYPAAIEGLKKSFGFDDGLRLVEREKFTIAQWNDMIYNELATNHPVPYGGGSSGGAHAFVIDGYDGEGLFHVNWGWGGMDDGYFRIAILNPNDNSGIGSSSSSDGYSMGQDAIIGMKLPDNIPAPPAPADTYGLSINDTQIDGNVITSNFVNWTGANRNYSLGIGVLQDDGTLTPVGNVYNNGMVTVDQTVTKYIYVNTYIHQGFSVTGLTKGSYKIVPMCKLLYPAGNWQTSFDTRYYYIIADVDDNGNATLSFHKPELVADKIDVIGTKSINRQQMVNAVFKNPGTEYYGEIHLFASKTTAMGSETSRSAVEVASNDSTCTSFFFTPQEAGTYNLWLAFDGAGKNVLAHSSVEITNDVQGMPLKVANVVYQNRNGNVLYGKFIDGMVDITNPSLTDTFVGDLKIQLWSRNIGDGSMWGGPTQTIPVSISPNSTISIPYLFDNLELNREYTVNYQALGKELENGGVFTSGRIVQLNSGIVYYYADGSRYAFAPTSFRTPEDVVAVDLRGSGRIGRIIPNANQNTLYLFDNNQYVADGLVASNIIMGDVAQRINLVDGKAYYSPTNFTANHISYTRTVSTGTDALSWETVVLPFQTQNILSDNTSLSWNDATGQNGNLWLMRFALTDEQTEAKFGYTNEQLANVPYLISVPQALKDKSIVFSADNAVIKASTTAKLVASTDAYTFIGTTTLKNLNDVYVLNPIGTEFVPATTATVDPFRAYFTTKLSASAKALFMPIVDSPTKIDFSAVEKDNQVVDVYNLNGIKVAAVKMVNKQIDLQQLPKGIYIVQGKKVVR